MYAEIHPCSSALAVLFYCNSFVPTAQAFEIEGKVSSDRVAIDAPSGFLFEWWSLFWDIFIARTNEKHSEVAMSYIETQLMKAREQQQQQAPRSQHPCVHRLEALEPFWEEP